MLSITSPDGTRLGVEVVGEGPPLLAVHGGIGDRSRWTLLKERVADRFTLHLLDRRGRGASMRETNGAYRLDREIDDVLAVIDAIGEPVRYLGHSYGALIGMEALARTDAIERALLYEPPFVTPGRVMIPAGVIDRIDALIAAGDREAALEVFYREALGADPAPFVAAAEAAHAAIPNSDVVLLHGQGHTMIDVDPDGFVREVLDFLG
jgi:pimeloyl-ACP methyl ester carboxylesterase